MNAVTFSSLRPLSQEGGLSTCCSKLRNLAEIITKIALQALFVGLSILMAALIFPASLHVIVLPIVGIGAAIISGLFFVNSKALSQVRPVSLPKDAPLGIVRRSGDQHCAFNSSVQALRIEEDYIPGLREWLRTPMTAIRTEEQIRQFFADYGAPVAVIEEFLADFRESPEKDFGKFLKGYMPKDERVLKDSLASYRKEGWIAEMNEESIRKLFAGHQVSAELTESFLTAYLAPSKKAKEFSKFLETYVPNPARHAALDQVKSVYEDLCVVKDKLVKFFKSCDQRRAEEPHVSRADIEDFRKAICSMPSNRRLNEPLSAARQDQVDAAEVYSRILELLPERYRSEIHFSKVQHLSDDEGKPAQNERSRTRETFRMVGLTFSSEEPYSLEAMLENEYEDRGIEPLIRRGEGDDARSYSVRAERSFVQGPPVLRLHIKRFAVSPRNSPKSPSLDKIHQEVSVPNHLEIALENREAKKYRLAGFVHHEGSGPNQGHYTAAREKGGNYYLIDDEDVTQVKTQEEWLNLAKKAYLFWYVPAEEG
jgi:hypothetical protein